MKKRDACVILSLLLVAAIVQGVLWLGRTPAAFAVVNAEGQQVVLLSLKENQTFEGIGASGPYAVEVLDGRVRMRSSDCPDAQCVRQGWIASAGQSVVCLPNQVAITLSGLGLGEANAPDAIAY